MEVPTPTPRVVGSQESPNDLLTEAVTTAVLHRQQVEDEAAASSSSGQEKALPAPATTRDPRRELGEPIRSDPVRPGASKGQGTPKLVETHTWEEMEGAVRQGARGTVEGTMGYALTVLNQMQTDMEERFRAQTLALQAGCRESEEFSRNPEMRELMGHTRYLWERNIALQRQVRVLTEEREDLVRQQPLACEIRWQN